MFFHFQNDFLGFLHEENAKDIAKKTKEKYAGFIKDLHSKNCRPSLPAAIEKSIADQSLKTEPSEIQYKIGGAWLAPLDAKKPIFRTQADIIISYPKGLPLLKGTITKKGKKLSVVRARWTIWGLLVQLKGDNSSIWYHLQPLKSQRIASQNSHNSLNLAPDETPQKGFVDLAREVIVKLFGSTAAELEGRLYGGVSTQRLPSDPFRPPMSGDLMRTEFIRENPHVTPRTYKVGNSSLTAYEMARSRLWFSLGALSRLPDDRILGARHNTYLADMQPRDFARLIAIIFDQHVDSAFKFRPEKALGDSFSKLPEHLKEGLSATVWDEQARKDFFERLGPFPQLVQDTSGYHVHDDRGQLLFSVLKYKKRCIFLLPLPYPTKVVLRNREIRDVNHVLLSTVMAGGQPIVEEVVAPFRSMLAEQMAIQLMRQDEATERLLNEYESLIKKIKSARGDLAQKTEAATNPTGEYLRASANVERMRKELAGVKEESEQRIRLLDAEIARLDAQIKPITGRYSDWIEWLAQVSDPSAGKSIVKVMILGWAIGVLVAHPFTYIIPGMIPGMHKDWSYFIYLCGLAIGGPSAVFFADNIAAKIASKIGNWLKSKPKEGLTAEVRTKLNQLTSEREQMQQERDQLNQPLAKLQDLENSLAQADQKLSSAIDDVKDAQRKLDELINQRTATAVERGQRTRAEQQMSDSTAIHANHRQLWDDFQPFLRDVLTYLDQKEGLKLLAILERGINVSAQNFRSILEETRTQWTASQKDTSPKFFFTKLETFVGVTECANPI